MSNYTPADWYWRHDDGRIYASARQAIVAADDEAYTAFVAAGGRATRWPPDEADEQTDAALAEVLAPYDLTLWPVPLKDRLTAYAADKRWRVETGGITVAGVAIATDDRSKQMIIGARIAADADAGWSTPWVAADGTVVPVDALTMIVISNAVLAHVSACFAIYAAVAADIEAGDITTTDEIDAADWP